MAKKDDKKKTTDELNSLFKPVEQKVAKGQISSCTCDCSVDDRVTMLTESSTDMCA